NLDVTGTDGLRMRVDNGDWISLAEITTASTINDLISVINSKANGITASIVNGQVQIQRDYAGAGSSYNFEIEDNGTGDVVQQVFGTNDLVVNSGTASTLQTLDTFTPTGRTALDPVVLALITDTNTGLVTGIDDIGGGGISTVTGNGGLQAGTLVIDTDDTQHAASITVYDSQGGRHNVTITFTKSINENTWYWEAQLGGNEIIRGSNTGQVIFNDDGSLAAFTFDGSATTFTFDPNNGAEDMEIAFDGGTANTYDGLTGFSNESTASAVSQDGYTSGSLNAISVDTNGLIIGIFSNGVSRTLAHIYLADFNNPAGLLKVGSSLFQESVNSGIAVSGIAGETVSGTMTSGALEMSNVDLAQEFTSMIVSQRGYQANARIITTSDQMLAELVQLKR
ncbi:MAG: flagellar hook-basal body complex protein, partial [candidate division Zixibacteria bacterium]|nr:flagellar hook-basal body complex protein [candidate division Zixibacteria bacterium]